MIQQMTETETAGAETGSRRSRGAMRETANKWKPATNHPWRQYHSVCMSKKRSEYLKEHPVPECF